MGNRLRSRRSVAAAFDRAPPGLDRAGDAFGHNLEELEIFLVERSALAPPNVQYAEDVVATHQRDAEHHLDALFPQDRIRDRRRVDLIEAHRHSCCCDTAGEPHSDGHPHSLTNFILDPTRGSRHECVALFVEQQHGSRVDIEDLAYASKQLDEQIIEIELRERAVRQRLKVRQTLRNRTMAQTPPPMTYLQIA